MEQHVQTIIEVQSTGRHRSRVFWRPIIALPAILFVYSFMPLGHWGWGLSGIIVVPVVLALVVRGTYPSYVLTFNHAIIELQTRVLAYLLLLHDDYPTIERNPKVAVMLPDVQGGKKLNQWLPLVKWFLAIPLYIVGAIYGIWVVILTIAAWAVTSATGNYPDWASGICYRFIQYVNRVSGYAVILVTDDYPSFKL